MRETPIIRSLPEILVYIFSCWKFPSGEYIFFKNHVLFYQYFLCLTVSDADVETRILA